MSGTPSRASSTAWACRSWWGAKRRRTPAATAARRNSLVRRRLTSAVRGPAVDHAEQRPDVHLQAQLEPGLQLFPAPRVHADFPASPPFAASDKQGAATRSRSLLARESASLMRSPVATGSRSGRVAGGRARRRRRCTSRRLSLPPSVDRPGTADPCCLVVAGVESGMVAGDRRRPARSSRSSDMMPPRTRGRARIQRQRVAADPARPDRSRYRFQHRAAVIARILEHSRVPRCGTGIPAADGSIEDAAEGTTPRLTLAAAGRDRIGMAMDDPPAVVLAPEYVRHAESARGRFISATHLHRASLHAELYARSVVANARWARSSMPPRRGVDAARSATSRTASQPRPEGRGDWRGSRHRAWTTASAQVGSPRTKASAARWCTLSCRHLSHPHRDSSQRQP